MGRRNTVAMNALIESIGPTPKEGQSLEPVAEELNTQRTALSDAAAAAS
jgi:hypothetical protein